MLEIDYKHARENFVEHKLKEAAHQMCLRGMNPTGKLFKKRLSEVRDRYD